MNAVDDRAKALQVTVDGLDKRYGKGVLMRLGERQVSEVEVVPTGSITLDALLGTGGWPRGRVIEVYGPESSGKTTLALHAVAEIQARGGTAAFIDAEHALDVVYAGKLGVDTDNLLVSQPDNGKSLYVGRGLAVMGSGAADCEHGSRKIGSSNSMQPCVGRDGEALAGHADSLAVVRNVVGELGDDDPGGHASCWRR